MTERLRAAIEELVAAFPPPLRPQARKLVSELVDALLEAVEGGR